ncbi:MAG: hypothetical protein RL754_1054 [Bacteroidota bacterium]
MGLFSFLFGSGKKQQAIKDALAAGHTVIDVRTPGEFKQGNFKGSINIPLNKIEGKAKSLTKEKQPVILCCRSGARAESARGILAAQGVQAINAGAWQSVVKASRS